MEKEHIYKFLFQLGIILLLAAIGIFCMTLRIDSEAEALMQLTFFGIYLFMLGPMFLISIILIIISKLKLNKIKRTKELSDKNV